MASQITGKSTVSAQPQPYVKGHIIAQHYWFYNPPADTHTKGRKHFHIMTSYFYFPPRSENSVDFPRVTFCNWNRVQASALRNSNGNPTQTSFPDIFPNALANDPGTNWRDIYVNHSQPLTDALLSVSLVEPTIFDVTHWVVVKLLTFVNDIIKWFFPDRIRNLSILIQISMKCGLTISQLAFVQVICCCYRLAKTRLTDGSGPSG